MTNWFNLVKYFLIKDIKSRYAGSGLGIFWTVMMPFFQIVLYWFVFSTVMRVRPHSNAHIPYVLFLLSTYFFWIAISESIVRSGMTIIENAELVKKVPFPVIILPISITLSCYLQSMVGVILFIIAYTFSGLSHLSLFLIVPVLFLQLLFSIGFGMLLAAIIPYMRDLQQIIGYMLQGMFFLSPILYSMEAIPETFRNLTYLNPVTLYVEAYHKVVFDGTLPGWWHMGAMALCSGLFLFLGVKVFMKLNEGFADIL
ncbi:MAG: ABC transporter permease [Nitrospiraceae bacterium]|nr:ABC transporter permease [Nitrospiraceae bacterium]